MEHQTGRSQSQQVVMGLIRLVFWCSMILVAFCLFVEGGRNGGVCSSSNLKTASSENGNRKVYGTFKGLRQGMAAGEIVRSNLRLVPSGPDPLHHNSSPRKPQTP